MASAFGKLRPLLRLSTLRLAAGMPHLLKTGQVGDGREDAILQRVLTTAEPGNVDDVIRVIDEFAHNDAILINIGDEKGLILDAAIALKRAISPRTGRLHRLQRSAHRPRHAGRSPSVLRGTVTREC